MNETTCKLSQANPGNNLIQQIVKLSSITTITFTVFALLFTGLLHAQQVHTYVDSDSLRVGDIFHYTIVFDGQYQDVAYPGEDAFEDDFVLISRQRYQLSERRDSLVYRLQFFGTDDITLSRKDIHVRTAEGDTTLQTSMVPLFFKTTLAEGDEEFRPFKPLFDFARSWWWLILTLILLAIAAYFAWRWYTNREVEEVKPEPEPALPPEPFVDPLEELKEAVATLTPIHKLAEKQDYEQFYIKLGDSIRYYLKRVYKITALEMTTREIIESLREELAPDEIIIITRKVLNEADMVKFANFLPGPEQAKSVLKKAESFIETAEIVNRDQIRYMKYKYDEKHGIKSGSSIMETAE